MTFTEIIYGWLIISTLSIAGPTWYAFPRTRLDLRAVDELEILLGCTERCLATQTNAIGYQAPPMRHIMQIRNTNGAMQTVTNALTWQLASKAMLTGNDAALSVAIPRYVQTNSATNYTTGFVSLTLTGLVDTLLAHTNGLYFEIGQNWTVDTNVLHVSGTLYPHAAGDYKRIAQNVWQYHWACITNSTDYSSWIIDGGSDEVWISSNQYVIEQYVWVSGDGSLYGAYHPLFDASGIATVEVGAITNYITLAPSAIYTNHDGVYSNLNWQIYESGGEWVCASNSPPSGYYFKNSVSTGAGWTAEGGFYTAGAESEEVDIKLGFKPWGYSPITFMEYEDRYKIENALEWTHRDAIITNMEYWRGYGKIETNASTPLTNGGALAYAAAVSNYALVSSYPILWPLRQYCSKKQWVERVNVGTNCYETNLVVNSADNILLIGTNINFQSGDCWQGVQTNILVTGGADVYPDARQLYLFINDALWKWTNDVTAEWAQIDLFPGYGSILKYFHTNGEVSVWIRSSINLEGTYEPVILATGTLTAAYKYGTNFLTLAPSGEYTNNGSGKWMKGGWTISGSAGDWTCASNSPPSGYYFENSNTDPTGTWAGVGFDTAGTASSLKYVYTNNPIDPSGTYTPTTNINDREAWRGGNWYALYSNGGYYITTNTTTLSPAWRLNSETPDGTYSEIVGGGITGTLIVGYGYLYEPIFENHIFYSCELQKCGVDYYAYTSTAMPHRVQGFYVYPTSAGVYYDQGLGLSNSTWNRLMDTVDFINSTENSFHIGGDLSVPPPEGPDASIGNEPLSYGFHIDAAKFIFDWQFRYATNGYFR